jgi:hypothetical protein
MTSVLFLTTVTYLCNMLFSPMLLVFLKKYFCLIAAAVFCLTFPLVGQPDNNAGEIYGITVNESGEILPSVHVVNPRTSKGTITNMNGRFRLQVQIGDTLVFSMLSFAYLYHVIQKEDFSKERRFVMKKENYLLDEVSIFSYQLTSNRPRTMPLRKPTVPDNKNIREPGLPSPAQFNDPLEAIYQAFSSRIKQLKILEELKARDAFYEKLEEGNNRHVLMRITGMSKEDLQPFLFFCQMGYDYIENATDYELLISLLQCYGNYVHARDMKEFMIMDDYD